MDSISPRSRVYFMDELRGLSILLMVIYHGAFDIVYLFHTPIPLFYHPVVQFLSVFFGGVFIFISGIACRYSHSNIRRGLICFAFALVLSTVTYLLGPGVFISFGILHFLGLSMLLYGLIKKWAERIPSLPAIIVLSLAFLFLFGLPHGYVGLPEILKIPVPEGLYQFRLGFIAGLPNEAFASADYYPLIPWLLLFLAGAYTGKYAVEGRFPSFMYKEHCHFLSTVGRHTMLIYLLHQPVVFGITYLVFHFLQK